MPAKDLRNLFLLATLWSGSFIFMLLSVHEFGPTPLLLVRLGVSALVLLGVAAAMGKLADIRKHWRAITLGGIISVALPFLFYAWAAQSLTASFMVIVNALTPLFGGLIARIWLGEHLTRARLAGLVIGFGGILFLVYDKLSFGDSTNGLAVAAAIAAPFCYGLAGSYTTKYLHGVDPIALATGSIASSALLIMPFALWAWPSTPISAGAWASATSLAVLCTALAYIMFFRLIERVGASRTMTVTFLVPPLGVLWGFVFLNETITLNMIIATAIVLCGTLLATGFIGSKRTA